MLSPLARTAKSLCLTGTSIRESSSSRSRDSSSGSSAASKEAGRANLTFRMPWPLIPVVVSLLRIAATSAFASLIRTANSSKPGRLPDREDWLLVPTAPSTSVTLINAGAVVLLKDGKIVDVIHIQGRPHRLSLDV